jgi:hypothetical protein
LFVFKNFDFSFWGSVELFELGKCGVQSLKLSCIL